MVYGSISWKKTMKNFTNIIAILAITTQLFGQTSLRSERTFYEEFETITIYYSGMTGDHSNWIGLYEERADDGDFITWKYANSTNGSLEFTGMETGKYEARAFFNNSYDLESKTSFAVGEFDNPTATTATWTTTASNHRGKNGESFCYSCPPNPSGSFGTIWGTDVYTDDSKICVAAVHAGIISNMGGEVCIEIMGGQSNYSSSTRNGVSSSSYGSWGGSFRFNNQNGGTTTTPSGSCDDMLTWTIDQGTAQHENGTVVYTDQNGNVCYYVAPSQYFGDISSYTGIQFSLRTQGGSFMPSYDDIIIEGNGGKATFEFHTAENHDGEFHQYTLSFNDMNWQTSGVSLSTILRNVTSITLQAEYGFGADNGSLRCFQLLGDGNPTGGNCPRPSSLNMNATNITQTSAQLTIDATGSYLWAVKKDGEEWFVYDYWSSPTLTLTYLSPNTNYQYRVARICENGLSEWSNTKSFRTDGATAQCTAPVKADMILKAVSTNSATIACSKSSESIDFRYKNVYEGNWINLGSTSSGQMAISNLSPNTEYHFQTRVYCNGYWSPWGVDKYFTTVADDTQIGNQSCQILDSDLSVRDVSSDEAYIDVLIDYVKINLWIKHPDKEWKDLGWFEGYSSYRFFQLASGTDYVAGFRIECEDGSISDFAYVEFTTQISYGRSTPKSPGVQPIQVTTVRNSDAHVQRDSEQIDVYPNPTQNYFTINGITDEIELTISTATGQPVKTVLANPDQTIDITGLSSGHYIITMIDLEGNITTKKLVITN